jgi:sugar O-acyltransferase (sialic acid O-acetyltransferase NeuD family)
MKLVGLGANNPQIIKIIKRKERQDPNFKFLGFIDNDSKKWNTNFFSYPIFGGLDKIKDLTNDDVLFCNFITRDCVTRYETSLELIKNGAKLTNLIDPEVDMDMVEIGIGNYIQEHVDIQAGVSIGNNSSIHLGSLISHESRIGDSVFISVNCNIAGLVNIEDGVFVGTGASIIPRKKIGKWSIIGAGSVIIDDVPPYSVVVGNPGKIIKHTRKKYTNGNIGI